MPELPSRSSPSWRWPWPLLTADLPGVGGQVVELDDFVVEELPAYLPCGAGEHTLVLLEKRGLTTPQAVQRLCARVGADPRQAGYAGLKDKHGVTRQWISVQGVDPAALLAVEEAELRVLEAGRHGNKLRTGHLRGNRFTITLRGVCEGAEPLARAIVARLASGGLPNYFGEQRFGRDGANARVGLQILRKEGRPPRDRTRRRLFISALQSQLFNDVLAARQRVGALDRLVGGEVLQRTDSGGQFVSDSPEQDAPRLASGEVVVTGPVCGPRMLRPLEGSPARELEDGVLESAGLTPEAFARLGRLARGGRRPLLVAVEHPSVAAAPGQARCLGLDFVLPPGSYATVLLREVRKSDAPS